MLRDAGVSRVSSTGSLPKNHPDALLYGSCIQEDAQRAVKMEKN